MKFFVTVLSLCSSLVANTDSAEKVYLTQEQIAIEQNHIWVCIGNEWVTTPNLSTDARGIYVMGRKWYEPWECSFCGVMNPPTNLVCWNCHH